MTARRLGSALATGLVVGVVAVLAARLGPLDAVVAGVVAAVLVLVGGSLEAGEEHRWPAVPHEEAAGARPAVAVLMWSFAGRDGRVSEAALRHLRRQAGRRLAGEGIVLDDGNGHLVVAPGGPEPGDTTRARELLGDRAWQVLTTQGTLPPVTEVAHTIEAVERLVPAQAPTPKGHR
jgi:hypothetical protein